MPILNLLTLKQALTLGANELTQSETPSLDSELILLHCAEVNRNSLFTEPDRLLSIEQQAMFTQLIQRRKQGEPVAYIIGEQGFWDLTLSVSPDTLIPRPDTESLVEWVLQQGKTFKRVLDLGTGTGALALALAREMPSASVLGLDVVEGAVQLANKNRIRNQVDNAEFIQSNWFDGVSENDPFDLIVSNPPYIDEVDSHLSQGDVRFEPKSALVAQQQGFHDLFLIADRARRFLQQEGVLVMEHGWQQAPRLREQLEALGYDDVGSGRDYGGNERFTFGVWRSR